MVSHCGVKNFKPLVNIRCRWTVYYHTVNAEGEPVYTVMDTDVPGGNTYLGIGPWSAQLELVNRRTEVAYQDGVGVDVPRIVQSYVSRFNGL